MQENSYINLPNVKLVNFWFLGLPNGGAYADIFIPRAEFYPTIFSRKVQDTILDVTKKIQPYIPFKYPGYLPGRNRYKTEKLLQSSFLEFNVSLSYQTHLFNLQRFKVFFRSRVSNILIN